MGHLVLERMYPAQLLLQKLAGAWVGPGWGLGGAWVGLGHTSGLNLWLKYYRTSCTK